ncbi:LapA family protein [Frigidibacter sp. ROC022]|uniref:LapA family protein n=1 Tax=Frigidibacter sp. ROC022 TaxID=2971796 RepID=UPI00215AEFC2|nr:LapA family protein [Frigidibacter sp. ROC022]MCR8722824.1 LapA family protein [Frigidibacter sp. ROC022]
MRYIRYAFLLGLGLVLVTIAFANRDPVTLRLMPDDLAGLLPWGRVIELPLFLVIFGAIIAGVAIGFVWEWLREHKYRATADRKSREAVKLKREVERIKGTEADKGDEILALLDGPAKT